MNIPEELAISYWRRMCLAAVARAEAAEAKLAEAKADKDAAYYERNRVVAALARLFPSGVKRTAIEGWNPEWHGCVYIDSPSGQLSWHFHDSHAHLFENLPPYIGEWDGHTTEQKYERLAEVRPVNNHPGAPTNDREFQVWDNGRAQGHREAREAALRQADRSVTDDLAAASEIISRGCEWLHGDHCRRLAGCLCADKARAVAEPIRRAERDTNREKVATFMMAHSLATGHGDTIEDLLIELGGQVEELRDRAAATQGRKGRE